MTPQPEDLPPALALWVETLQEKGEAAVLLDNCHQAVIGTCEIGDQAHAVYSRDALVRLFCERDGMTYAEAHDYIAFNCEAGSINGIDPLIIDPV